jgi:arsenate reductase
MKQKVLFLCTHNSARSQIAEGLLRTLYGNNYDAYSAGLEPTTLNPYAIKVMKEIRIDLSKQHSKSINEFKEMKFDFVVTVCDNAREACPFFPGKKVIHKSFEDPAEFKGNTKETLEVFRRVRDEIKSWVLENF